MKGSNEMNRALKGALHSARMALQSAITAGVSPATLDIFELSAEQESRETA
jgi:hypothetical protein